jgi:hypothetical protein
MKTKKQAHPTLPNDVTEVAEIDETKQHLVRVKLGGPSNWLSEITDGVEEWAFEREFLRPTIRRPFLVFNLPDADALYEFGQAIAAASLRSSPAIRESTRSPVGSLRPTSTRRRPCTKS